MDGNDSSRSLLGKKFTAAKASWLADAADIFVLLCSSLLIAASIVLVALIFHTQITFQHALVAEGTYISEPAVPKAGLSILQRAVSALSITVTSAVIMVAGKRYVLYKLAREGIRSRRVAIYSHPSVGNVARYLARHGFELPLLALLAVWALGLATGLMVNDAWGMVPVVNSTTTLGAPFGPFDVPAPAGSLFLRASGQLSYVMDSVCSGVFGAVGLINVTSGAQMASGGPMGALFYPPPPYYIPNSAFSVSTALNGFNVSAEPLSSVPTTAQNLTCVDSTGDGFSTGQLWYEGADNQTLSIVAIFPFSQTPYRLNASAIVLGGTLQSTGSSVVFTPNGTTWPNVMSDDRWAQDIANLVCNTTILADGCAGAGPSLTDFSVWFNAEYNSSLSHFGTDSQPAAELYWSTTLGMAIGAYSWAPWPSIGTTLSVSVTRNDVGRFTARYGVYVLIANVVVSIVMLVVVVRLRTESRLGADFLNATRLLLDPLKSPELFNASLDTTVDALANPYMLVREESEFLLTDRPFTERTR